MPVENEILGPIVCPSCDSEVANELPVTVDAATEEQRENGEEVLVVNKGRTRTEYLCVDCGAVFVRRPLDPEVRR